MIVTKMAFYISIQTHRQTISNSLQTLHKADQTLCKLFSNALQTSFKLLRNLFKCYANSFQTLSNAFQTLLKAFQTFSKRFANALQTPRKRRLAQIAMFDKTCFPMEGHIFELVCKNFKILHCVCNVF